MTTERQIRANQANARKSTGPRTEAGQQASRRNAVRHGLTAEHVILAGEDPGEFERLRAGLEAEYAPAGEVERFLVERLAGLMWRLSRVPGFEAGIVAWIAHLQAETHDAGGIAFGDLYFAGDQRALPPPTVHGNPLRYQHRRVGRTLETMLSTSDPFGKLARYEGQLLRGLGWTLAELGKLQALRRQVGHKDDKARSRDRTGASSPTGDD